jgi:hypothetical protein
VFIKANKNPRQSYEPCGDMNFVEVPGVEPNQKSRSYLLETVINMYYLK